MNDNRHDERAPSAAADDRAPISPQPDARSQRVASRRYVLLKGATRGAAILTAATPIKTLASIPSVTSQVDGLLCTISGTQSGVISAKTSLPTCGGMSPGYYTKLKHWPNYSESNPKPTYTVGGKDFGPDTSFNVVFSGGSSKSLVDIMTTKPRIKPEFHWIAALLNAIAATFPEGYIFPYEPGEVLTLYADPQKSADALKFFKDFTETHGRPPVDG